MNVNNNQLEAVLEVGIALSAQKNRNQLFNMIINRSMEIANCDAGTLYIYNGDALEFKIMKTLSMGVDRGEDGKPIDIPPVPIREENICAYVAIHQEPMNIPDVYTSDRFDFSGPKNYDKMTGFHTQSMMAIPLINADDETVGVLQLMNAMDEDGTVIPFDDSLEKIILALASQTAIAVSNMRYQAEIKEQMWSFTEAMAAAIDERTPYNASHTRKVAEYSGKLADYINELNAEGKEEEYFSENRREQLVMGALLHDIGKLVTPLEVMNKATRLGDKKPHIIDRLNIYRLQAKIACLENRLSSEEFEAIDANIVKALEIVDDIDSVGFVNDELRDRLESVIDICFNDKGESFPLFTDDEKECLRIVKGTLTNDERKIMESHVEVTRKILDKVHFNSYFANSPKWAVEHHECLNGKGYPLGLNADDLKLESRILAVADICDALLATDRPYKKPIPKEKAFDIMRDMAKFGNIDGKLVEYLYQCIDK